MTDQLAERYHVGVCIPEETEAEKLEEVNIQCLQSSEFVLGKQNNFNGPVTIISCTETTDGTTAREGEHKNEEKIIIRDKLSHSKPENNQNPIEHGNPEGKKEKWWKSLERLTKIPTIPVFTCVGILVAICVGFAVFFATVQPEPKTIGRHLFYAKQDWGGKPPKSAVEMRLPVPYAIVSHTVTTACSSLKSCAPRLRNMQDYHFSLDFADLSYNFLVDSNGSIYEGRGWTRRNTMGGFVSGRSIDVALIGDYSQAILPSEDLLDGLKELLEYGVANGKIASNYSLLAANSTAATLSPGKNVYAVIKHWPHFDPDPKSHVKEYDV